MALTNATQTPANPTGPPSSDVPSTILRDQWKRPLIVRPDGTVGAYTRASSIGGVLEDQTGLGIWRMRQVAWGMGRRRDLVLASAAIPTTDASEDKERLKRVAWDAFDAAESGAKATIGTALHALTERTDAGLDIPDIGDDQDALDAYTSVARRFRFHATEQFTVCDEREVSGTFDRVAEPLEPMQPKDRDGRPIGDPIGPGERLVWDLKTSGSSDYFGIKFAAQLAAYATGVPYRGWEDEELLAAQTEQGIENTTKAKMARTRGERLDWPDGVAPRTDWALICHVPSGRSEAQLYWVNLELGRELLKLACEIQQWRKCKDLVVPAELPRTPMDTALNGAGLRSLIEHAADRQACKALWVQHKSMWTAEHTALVTARFPA